MTGHDLVEAVRFTPREVAMVLAIVLPGALMWGRLETVVAYLREDVREASQDRYTGSDAARDQAILRTEIQHLRDRVQRLEGKGNG